MNLRLLVFLAAYLNPPNLFPAGSFSKYLLTDMDRFRQVKKGQMLDLTSRAAALEAIF